jgi:hypothetical protein
MTDELDVPQDDFVTRADWRHDAARPDAIDEIADEFERRAAPEHQSAPVARGTARGYALARWPSRSRGWHSDGQRPATRVTA